MSDNPLLEPWTGPFGLPPFDRIRPEHFPPAFDRAMADHAAEVDAIARNPAAPTFANTVEAMERAGRLYDRVARVFFNLTGSHTSDALEAIARDYAPKMARHRMKIALDPVLFARVSALHARVDDLGLAEDQRRLLNRQHLGFVRAGARLAPEAKARMSEITQRLATLHTLFGQNVLHDEKDWQLVLGEDDLDGLPPSLRAAAAQAATERGHEGKFVVTLARSLVEPFLTFSARRDLRQVAFEAWTRRGEHDGPHDNRPLITEIMALRTEQARLLGYPDFAAYRLDDSMAKTPDAVEDLLLAVWEPAKRRAEEERAALQALARAEGMNAPVEPWDWRYYAEKVRQARYALDEAAIKPYFALEKVAAAAFETAGRLFGLGFTERPDVPVYHPDVKVYEVTDRAGAHVAVFVHDNFARSSKRSGAWMSSFRVQEGLDGPVSPVIANNNNFSKASPTLLSFDDARTLFHEFGHALHGIMSKVRYPSQSGTSVRRDFVEFPSQVMEHWIASEETLREFAVHHETGTPIPEDLLARILAARTFNQGFQTVEYTAAALLDLEMHRSPDDGPVDPTAFEAAVKAKIGMPSEIAIRHRAPHFQHLFAGDGYAAGYYAYLWAEVLDADGFEAFVEAGDLFDPALAERLGTVFAAGDTVDPMALYAGFRGRPPSIDPLLRQRGLV
ncbi:MAG: M3 family metallopeptidase [Rhodospirillales bacterium]|jgi:peptidyl-dipeptidase Dcp